MRVPNRKTKLVDLTPLLDVFVILLFALLFNMSVETKASEESVESLAEQVRVLETSQGEQIQVLEESLISEETENQQLVADNERLKENISQISEEQNKINKAIVEWMTKRESSDNPIITQVMIEQLFDEDHTKQRLFELAFIANQFFFIEIYVDASQQYMVYLNNEPTQIFMDFEEEISLRAKDIISVELLDALEKLMTEAESGYNNVIFTLKDDGNMHSKAFNLIWEVLKDIELKYGTDDIYKIQYLTY